MSVFRIFKLTVDHPHEDYESEYEGTRLAAARFEALYDPAKFKSIYDDLVYDLIKNHSCTVRYTDEEHLVRAKLESGNKKIYYIDEKTGNEVKINLKVVQDDPGVKNLHMVVPPEKVVIANQDYLGNAVKKIAIVYYGSSVDHVKPTGDIEAAKAFLFGLLLLKRCR